MDSISLGNCSEYDEGKNSLHADPYVVVHCRRDRALHNGFQYRWRVGCRLASIVFERVGFDSRDSSLVAITPLF